MWFTVYVKLNTISSRLLARSFTAIVPYFPTGTMEREETEGQVATAKVHLTCCSFSFAFALVAIVEQEGQFELTIKK